ncbi:MAG: glycogen/starch synthase [Bergeyella zoohelcum]|nr:glycogen/starch synthase [Bergeyella zoohelcum]
MPNQRILYITTEMFPYQEESSMANMVNKMALKMYRSGNDVRVFMPRFGSISERKFQLHEVIRLSGMNVIINDLDQPLIIKVGSLPGERLQVYFIDNDEYFKRKPLYIDEEGVPFKDNGERAVFFAKGVVETIKKLNWVPDVIHINGWMASFVLLYLNTYYKDDYFFKNTKMVVSAYNEQDIKMDKTIEEVLKFDNITDLASLKKPTTRKFAAEIMSFADVLAKGDEFLEEDVEKVYKKVKTKKVDFVESDSIDTIY